MGCRGVRAGYRKNRYVLIVPNSRGFGRDPWSIRPRWVIWPTRGYSPARIIVPEQPAGCVVRAPRSLSRWERFPSQGPRPPGSDRLMMRHPPCGIPGDNAVQNRAQRVDLADQRLRRSGRRDSNPRPQRPERCASAGSRREWTRRPGQGWVVDVRGAPRTAALAGRTRDGPALGWIPRSFASRRVRGWDRPGGRPVVPQETRHSGVYCVFCV